MLWSWDDNGDVGKIIPTLLEDSEAWLGSGSCLIFAIDYWDALSDDFGDDSSSGIISSDNLSCYRDDYCITIWSRLTWVTSSISVLMFPF